MNVFIKQFCFTAISLSISILANAQSDELTQSIVLEALNLVDEFKEKFESRNPSSIIDQFETTATIYNAIYSKVQNLTYDNPPRLLIQY